MTRTWERAGGVAVEDRERGSTGVTALDLCRPATTVTEAFSLLDAWRAVRHDPDRYAVVVRGRRPIGAVTAGRLAEVWPGGGPAVADSTQVVDVLTTPVGVAAVEAGDDLGVAARGLVAARAASVPVVTAGGDLIGVLSWPDVMTALLDGAPVDSRR